MCGLIYSTVEMSEIQFPFFYHEYEYVKDTAAPGQWRGVPGFAMKRESVRDTSMINVALTGVRHPSPGFAGGRSGASSRYVLNWGSPDEVEVLESAANTPSPPGSIIATFKGGGGGWGDPLERDPEMVLSDVMDDLISVERAAQDYGVVITADADIDHEATAARRAAAR
jgi:N-methylhydantoinase B